MAVFMALIRRSLRRKYRRTGSSFPMYQRMVKKDIREHCMLQLHTDFWITVSPSYPVEQPKQIHCLPIRIIPTSIWMKVKMPWIMN